MRQKDPEDRIAVLVVSCDAYSDLWEPFVTLFKRFWPDCPHKIYLCANHKSFERPGLTTLTVGTDTSWSSNVHRALAQLEQDFVFLLLDDLLLTSRVDNDSVRETFRWFIESGGNCIRMNPSPPPDRACESRGAPSHIGLSSPGTLYRVSTVATLWQKETLLHLLKDGESAWDFEVHGTVRSDSLGGFYASRRRHFVIINAIVKGKWVPAASRQVEALGIRREESRAMMNRQDSMRLRFAKIRSRALHLVPARWRRAIKDAILGGKYNYRISK